MRVYITSLDPTENGNRFHETKLLEIYQKSDKKHTIVDNPDEAQIILLGNADDKTGEKILSNPIINKFPQKCFSISDKDITLFLNRGIYTSANNRSVIGWRRLRTGSYTLLPDRFTNPYIAEMSNRTTYKKKFLFSFIGRNCHAIRTKIFNLNYLRQDVLIEDSSSTFDVWKTNVSAEQKQLRFGEILAQSKFSLCPRGAIANSIRLFESLQIGVAPVIIADSFLLPKGPDWRKFSIIIKEKDIDQLENIVSSFEANFVEMGALAKQCYDNYFSEKSYFNYTVDNCIDVQKTQIIPEKLYWYSKHAYLSYLTLKKRIFSRL